MLSPIGFFFISLLFIYSIVRTSKSVQTIILKFGDYLLKTAFPSFSEFEQYKFALLRFLFGLIIFIRAFYIQQLLIPVELFTIVGIFSLMGLTAAIMVMLGLLTQWSLIFLVFVMWHTGDMLLGTSTLGNMIAAMLSLLLFLTAAGKYLSIDSILMDRYDSTKKIFLYFENFSVPKNIALAKFATLLCYWAVCIYSLSMHINEPAWKTGSASPLLLTNSYLTSGYQFFESIFSSYEITVHMARILLWIMMLWYALILPLTLRNGFYKQYVISWGIIFFIFSLLILNLGSLAKIEFLLWAAIFWSDRGLNSKYSLSVFFDDKCNLCDKTVQLISLIDIFGRINLKPVSLNHKRLQELNISPEAALSDLYGLIEETGELRSGYDFYILLSKNLVLLWPVFPVLYLGKALKIGPQLYRLIVSRRREIFGTCTFPRIKVDRHLPYNTHAKCGFLHSAIIVHVFFLALCYLIALPAPYIGIQGVENVATLAANYYGIAPIDVFNKPDLKLGENWFTLKSISHSELVPISSEFGTRLSMHNSDRVYFGNTLRYRRRSIGQDKCVFEYEKKISIEYLAKVYLHLKNAHAGSYQFIYDQYHQALPDMEEITRGKFNKNERLITCTVLFDVRYST